MIFDDAAFDSIPITSLRNIASHERREFLYIEVSLVILKLSQKPIASK